MAEYTIELGKLITLAGFDIGLNDYPLPEFLKSAGDRESWRKALNQKILNHYQFNEICCLPPDRFKVLLNNTMNEIMPYYNNLYEAMNVKWEFFTGGTRTAIVKGDATDDRTVTRTGTDTLAHTGNDTTTSEGKHTDTDTNYNLGVASDTPGQMLNIENDIANNTYASSATKSKGNSQHSGNNSNTDTTDYNSTDTTTHNTTDKDKNLHNDNKNRTVNGLNNRSYAELFKEYSESIRNLDLEVINELKDCFMGIL